MSATVPELSRRRSSSKLGLVAGAVAALLVCGAVGAVLLVQREAHESMADLPEMTAAPGPPALGPSSRTFVLSVVPASAHVSGAAGLERGSVLVGNEQRITLEIPALQAPALRVSAPGFVEQTIELRPELGSSFAVALHAEAPHVAAVPSVGGASAKKGGRYVAPAKPAAAPPPAAAKPCKRVSPGVDPFATGDCQH